MGGIDATLESARAALADHDWQAAFDAFGTLDARGALSPEALESLSEAAFWSGHPTEALDAVHRAFAAYVETDRLADASSAAIAAALLHFGHGEMSVATAWTDRARRLLVDLPECAAHARLAWIDGHVMRLLRSYEQALEQASEVEDIAARVGDRDFVALALAMQGDLRVRTGDVTGGMRLIGEAMAGAIAGERGSFACAEIFCEMVMACLDQTDYERAAEWLETAERAGQDLVCFPGCCRTHRATLLRHRGAWSEAQRQARQARAEVAGIEVLHEGMALTEIGELHRCKGDLALAEHAFAEAYEKGWPPQPGLARLALASGDVDDAAAMIARSVDEATEDAAALVHLLPAQVEIALAAGRIEIAAAAADRLAEVARRFGTAAADASTAWVAGLVLEARGDLPGATTQLEQSVRLWQRASSPYEAAQARMRLASVCLAAGDAGSARRELNAALATFERLGATAEIREASQRLGDDSPRESCCTFMFTDIVDSTALLSAIGDQAWHAVRQWHDRTLRDIAAEHFGRVVKETGDGFFVAFDDPTLAVDGAVAIQRALAEHRRTDGFSPSVRIGLHTGSAIAIDDDYAGRDVVVAARVAAVASADEILVSAALAERLATQDDVRPCGTKVLKGLAEPVEIARVDWR